jgi:non-ribosomal peptide synthetase component F
MDSGPDRAIWHGLHGHFLATARAYPDRVALRAGKRSLTYGEVHRTALAWASALVESIGGLPPTIAILARRGPDAYIGILAALYAGAAAVPLDVEFPAARTHAMLRAARPAAVIADRQGIELLSAVPDHPLILRADSGNPEATGEKQAGRDARSEKPAGTTEIEPWPVEPGDRAYIMFTSGSPGRPKGVPISHGNAAHHLHCVRSRYGFGPRTCSRRVSMSPSTCCSSISSVRGAPERASSASPAMAAPIFPPW